MEQEPMRTFLSAESISTHREYLKKLRLKYSVLCKSAPMLAGLDLLEVWRKMSKSDIKTEAVLLLSEITAHEIYFDSFSERRTPCGVLRKAFGSEDAFLYELYKTARGSRSGFLYVFADTHGSVRCELHEDGGFFFTKQKPLLALDLFEHAYFRDYGFERERYIESAISRLDLSKIKEYFEND